MTRAVFIKNFDVRSWIAQPSWKVTTDFQLLSKGTASYVKKPAIEKLPAI
ncbi:hypothetical protein P353_25685 [Comamonas testosteroni]|uniref:Uncharacterized protein n=1 Tax=Comamonas testosteroni TaxID=285 RepID=A0A096F4R8_COMTE|nr:hypothetical protein P353_25685 [Comamonas testosteroni]